MLPQSARLRRSAEFRGAVHTGRHAARGALVLHLLTPPPPVGAVHRPAAPARVGLVVSKSVGGAVVRNTVARRLRHLVRARLDQLPADSRLVVSARPLAAGRDSAALDRDLAGALGRLSATR